MGMDVLRAIAGIDTFPVISLVLFVTAFALVVVWALRMDRQAADRLAALPLDQPPAPPAGRGAATSPFEGGSRVA